MKAIEDRPAAILQARLEGDSLREIAKVAKLSEAGVRKIINNQEKRSAS